MSDQTARLSLPRQHALLWDMGIPLVSVCVCVCVHVYVRVGENGMGVAHQTPMSHS